MSDRHPDRPFDIVLFGATGFTGGLTADYLAAHAPVLLQMELTMFMLSNCHQRSFLLHLL